MSSLEAKAARFLDFIQAIEPLKSVTRHSWTASGRHESVPEHAWRMAIMARLLAPECPGVDMRKVVDMCLFHDLGEIAGDVPGFDKQAHDDEREFGLFRHLIDDLPQAQRDELLGLQREFDAAITPEAQIANALDKLEAVIQHIEADLSTWADVEYDILPSYGEQQAAFHPFLKTLHALLKKKVLAKMTARNETTPYKPPPSHP